ncbi:MAG: hypothetical protein JXB00_14555, partial [Bacteroidales bacterium]|nr:hypothetical protein [Bacteroidales bacterium]
MEKKIFSLNREAARKIWCLLIILAFLPVCGFSQYNDTILKYFNFDNNETGYYYKADCYDDFQFGSASMNMSYGIIDDIEYRQPSYTDYAEIVGLTDKSLRGLFSKASLSSRSGFAWYPEFGEDLSEMYFSYDMKFKEGFEFAEGGKLPGAFEGGYSNFDLPVVEYGSNYGWAMTCMWTGRGGLQSYIYYPDMYLEWGESHIVDGFYFRKDVWYNIAFRVVINSSVSTYDGIYEIFINGKKALGKTDFRLRQNTVDGIERYVAHTFFGGADSCTHRTWRDEYIDFDNFCIFMPDTVGSVPQGNNQTWGSEDTIPVPYTKVDLTGWDIHELPDNCPYNLTNECGYIIYYDSIVDYPSNDNCVFNIEVTDADSIVLHFVSYMTEGCEKADYIDIKETNSGGNLVESLWGIDYTIPFDVSVTTNDIYMNFISDASLEGSGFRAYYYAYKDGAMMDSSCFKGKDIPPNETDIISFTLPQQTGAANINSTNHTVAIEVEYGTNLTSLTPTIVVSNGATIEPVSNVAVDFSSSPVEYQVTAEDDVTQQTWYVTVTVEQEPPCCSEPTKYEYYDDTKNTYIGTEDWIIGQTFLIGDVGENTNFIIDSIGLQMWRDGWPGTLTFYLYEANSSTYFPTGSVLSTGEYDGNSLLHEGEMRYISMSSYELQASTYYCFYFEESEIGENYAFADGVEIGGYVNGDCIRNNGNWDRNTDFDLIFEIWG